MALKVLNFAESNLLKYLIEANREVQIKHATNEIIYRIFVFIVFKFFSLNASIPIMAVAIVV